MSDVLLVLGFGALVTVVFVGFVIALFLFLFSRSKDGSEEKKERKPSFLRKLKFAHIRLPGEPYEE